MAERSLAGSEFLDPTTAVQCIDRLHDGLRQLAGRVIPDGILRDDHGAVRLTIPTLDWDAYVHLAFDEIRLVGATSPQISRRMRAALKTSSMSSPPRDAPHSSFSWHFSKKLCRQSPRQPPDIRFAMRPDSQGIGAAASRHGDLEPSPDLALRQRPWHVADDLLDEREQADVSFGHDVQAISAHGVGCYAFRPERARRSTCAQGSHRPHQRALPLHAPGRQSTDMWGPDRHAGRSTAPI